MGEATQETLAEILSIVKNLNVRMKEVERAVYEMKLKQELESGAFFVHYSNAFVHFRTDKQVAAAAESEAFSDSFAHLSSSLHTVHSLVSDMSSRDKERAWTPITVTDDNFDAMLKQYPLTDWEWGCTYNTTHPVPVIMSSWNLGIRVAVRDAYYQGDTKGTLKLGRAAWVRGLRDTSQTKFEHVYPEHGGGNGQSLPSFYVRRL